MACSRPTGLLVAGYKGNQNLLTLTRRSHQLWKTLSTSVAGDKRLAAERVNRGPAPDFVSQLCKNRNTDDFPSAPLIQSSYLKSIRDHDAAVLGFTKTNTTRWEGSPRPPPPNPSPVSRFSCRVQHVQKKPAPRGTGRRSSSPNSRAPPVLSQP